MFLRQITQKEKRKKNFLQTLINSKPIFQEDFIILTGKENLALVLHWTLFYFEAHFKTYNKIETEQNPVGSSWVQLLSIPLPPPPFLVCRKKAPFSFWDLPWVPKSLFKQLLIKERGNAGTKAKQSRKNTVVIKQGPGSSWRNIHNKIFDFCKN